MMESIGVFDSGLGGLTAVKELIQVLPNESIVYFGDTGRVPYGNKSKETIQKYAHQDVDFLKSKNVKLILAACGTVSSVVNDLKDDIEVPFIGVVEPTSIAAVKKTRNKKIGIIGTDATIASGSYKKHIWQIDPSIEIFEKACPLLVPIVESGLSQENDIVSMTVAHYLAELKGVGIDTLILGCTHYPIISDVIRDFMGDDVSLINVGKEAALYAAQVMREKGILSSAQQHGNYSFYVSDSEQYFLRFAGIFLGYNLSCKVSRVDIEKFC